MLKVAPVVWPNILSYWQKWRKYFTGDHHSHASAINPQTKAYFRWFVVFVRLKIVHIIRNFFFSFFFMLYFILVDNLHISTILKRAKTVMEVIQCYWFAVKWHDTPRSASRVIGSFNIGISLKPFETQKLEFEIISRTRSKDFSYLEQNPFSPNFHPW